MEFEKQTATNLPMALPPSSPSSPPGVDGPNIVAHSKEFSENICHNPYQTTEDMHVLRETHKYIFFGPSRKDLKNTYFQAVYLFEKKLRIQAGQKVILTHNSKEEYGVALVGKKLLQSLLYILHRKTLKSD